MVFTDVVDSTAQSSVVGDETWASVITSHFSEVERLASANGGFLVKTTGDGAMLAFGSARMAVQTAIELERSVSVDESHPLTLRIGVHVGEAVKTDADYFGQSVNKAARIMAAADPGQILVSDLVRNLVGEVLGVSYGPKISLELKGFPGTQSAYPVASSGG